MVRQQQIRSAISGGATVTSSWQVTEAQSHASRLGCGSSLRTQARLGNLWPAQNSWRLHSTGLFAEKPTADKKNEPGLLCSGTRNAVTQNGKGQVQFELDRNTDETKKEAAHHDI